MSVGKTEKYDLIIIDGIVRDKCLKYVLENNINDSSIIYLDDSDVDSTILKEFEHFTEMRLAENLMRNHSVKNRRIIYSCRNFSPTHLFVKEGMFSVSRVFAEDKELTKIIP